MDPFQINRGGGVNGREQGETTILDMEFKQEERLDKAGQNLDQYIEISRNALQDLYEQRDILKVCRFNLIDEILTCYFRVLSENYQMLQINWGYLLPSFALLNNALSQTNISYGEGLLYHLVVCILLLSIWLKIM